MTPLYDMHVHSENSHDSTTPVTETAKFCIEKQIKAFAITDHCDIQYYIEQNVPSLIEKSINDVENARKIYNGKVKILKGIEIGEAIWNESYTKEILEKFDYDVIISSVHAVRYKNYSDPYSTIDFSKMDKITLDNYIKTYFDEVMIMLKQVDFDIMAHLTCPFRYIIGKYKVDVDIRKYETQIDNILDYIVEHSILMEINTSGINSFYNSFMPDEWIIQKFKEKGGYLVTLGSDAHTSHRVANGFEEAINLLKKYDFDGYYYFEKRQKNFVKI